MATAGQARSQGSGSYQVDAHGPVAGGRDSAAAAVFTTGDGRCSRRASRNTCLFFSGSAFAGVVVGALPLVGFERDMEACLIAGLVLVVRVRVPSRRSIRPVVYQHFGVVQVAVAERRALFGGNAAVHITGPLATIGYLPAAQSSAEQSRFQICPPVGVGIGSDDAFVRISHWLGVPPAMGVRRALQHREVHGLPGPPAQQSRSMIRPLPPAQQRRQATAGSHSIRAGSVPHDRGPGRRRRRLLALAQLREQG